MRLSTILATAVLTTIGTGVAQAQGQGKGPKTNASGNLIIKDIDLDGLRLVNGLVTATGGTVSGTLAGAPFETDIENFALRLIPAGPQAGCSILNLELAPIEIAVLGLFVDTSPICLEIAAIPGGGLLCGIAGGRLPLGLLEGSFLLDGLTEILTTALRQDDPMAEGDDSICTGECEILDLVLGPLDLTLLGLNVYLDDCNDGPVEVCVNASEDEGLLGELLCGLAGVGGLLDDITLKDIAQLVKKFAR